MEHPGRHGQCRGDAVLVGLGVYWVAIAVFSRRVGETRWVWALPFALSIDNITYGLIDHAWSSSVAVKAIEQLVSSALLALIGLVLSAAVLRALPGAEQSSRVFMAGFAGAALIVAAPLLLAVG